MAVFKVACWVTEQSFWGAEVEAHDEEQAKELFKSLVNEDPSILEPVGSKYNFDYDLDRMSIEKKESE